MTGLLQALATLAVAALTAALTTADELHRLGARVLWRDRHLRRVLALDAGVAALAAAPAAVAAGLTDGLFTGWRLALWLAAAGAAGLFGPPAVRARRGRQAAAEQDLTPLLRLYAGAREQLLDRLVDRLTTRRWADAAAPARQLAGRGWTPDTFAVALGAHLAEMDRHPDAAARIRAELSHGDPERRLQGLVHLARASGGHSFLSRVMSRGPTDAERAGGSIRRTERIDALTDSLRGRGWTPPLVRVAVAPTLADFRYLGVLAAELDDLERTLDALADRYAREPDADLLRDVVVALVDVHVLEATVSALATGGPTLAQALEAGVVLPVPPGPGGQPG